MFGLFLDAKHLNIFLDDISGKHMDFGLDRIWKMSKSITMHTEPGQTWITKVNLGRLPHQANAVQDSQQCSHNQTSQNVTKQNQAKPDWPRADHRRSLPHCQLPSHLPCYRFPRVRRPWEPVIRHTELVLLPAPAINPRWHVSIFVFPHHALSKYVKNSNSQ